MEIVIQVLAGLAILGTFIPALPSKHWIISGHHYFKNIYLGLNLIFLVALLWFPINYISIVILFLLAVAVIYCIRLIIPFTFLYPKSIKNKTSEKDSNSISLFIFNVYQFNDQYQLAAENITEADADIVFLVETNNDWSIGLSTLSQQYPYQVREIREDTYGLMLLSKIPFHETSVRYLICDDIPSVEVLVKVNEQNIRLFGVHPKPPSPTEATYSTSKDKELITIAHQIVSQPKEESTILFGDLNDVAWSKVSTEFKKISKMKDPRQGRGFYSTFPTYSFLKIPLDHLFCSSGFDLIEFKILEDIGSDHYPVLVKLAYK